MLPGQLEDSLLECLDPGLRVVRNPELDDYVLYVTIDGARAFRVPSARTSSSRDATARCVDGAFERCFVAGRRSP